MNQLEKDFMKEDDIEKLMLVEIGPRFTLNPIKAFDDLMGGESLWQNKAYFTPAKIRSKKYNNFMKKREQKEQRKEQKKEIMEDTKQFYKKNIHYQAFD